MDLGFEQTGSAFMSVKLMTIEQCTQNKESLVIFVQTLRISEGKMWKRGGGDAS